MEPWLVALVLAAAVMHAVWNAFLKADRDRLMYMATVMSVGAPCAVPLLFVAAAPAAESWPYLLLSVVFHNAYYFLLIQAYRFGDLSHAYPLARGSAPLMVAAGAWVFAGERLGVAELVAIGVISGGIISLLFTGGRRLKGGWRSIVYPLGTGALIASYTVSDALGVRASRSPLGYIAWLFFVDAFPIALIALAVRRRAAVEALSRSWKTAVLGGVLAVAAYGLVIYALSLGAAAHISALRETSVIIGALIGARLLRESFGARRVLAAAVVAGGVVLLQAAG